MLCICIIEDAKEERREDLMDGREIVISQVAGEGHKAQIGFGKESGDGVEFHWSGHLGMW